MRYKHPFLKVRGVPELYIVARIDTHHTEMDKRGGFRPLIADSHSTGYLWSTYQAAVCASPTGQSGQDLRGVQNERHRGGPGSAPDGDQGLTSRPCESGACGVAPATT